MLCKTRNRRTGRRRSLINSLAHVVPLGNLLATSCRLAAWSACRRSARRLALRFGTGDLGLGRWCRRASLRFGAIERERGRDRGRGRRGRSEGRGRLRRRWGRRLVLCGLPVLCRRRWRWSWVLEAVADFAREVWLAVGRRRGTVSATWVHFVPYVSNSNRALCLLIELHDLHHGLGVALLLETRDAAVGEELLPFLWQTGELAGG